MPPDGLLLVCEAGQEHAGRAWFEVLWQTRPEIVAAVQRGEVEL